jgi:hypothetical protein
MAPSPVSCEIDGHYLEYTWQPEKIVPLDQDGG